MKRVFFFISMLLTTLSMSAQSHWTFDQYGYPDETIVYCDIVSEDADATIDMTKWEVAAFIENAQNVPEVRAVATATQNPQIQTHVAYLFTLRVKGDLGTENGKTITFKLYNTETGLEYDAKLVESPLPIVFDGETNKDPGNPSNLRHLYVTEITSLSLPREIRINKGEEVDLTDYLIVSPASASIPTNLTWDFGNSSAYINVVGNKLTGVAANTDGVYLGVSAGQLSTSTTVFVLQPATAIDILSDYSTITVAKDDWQDLMSKLNAAVVLTPQDATDNVVWSSADPTIVGYMDSNGAWYPLAGGTTTMTAQIIGSDGAVRLSAQLTVIVTSPVTGISIPNYKTIDLNVGDDATAVTNFLNSIVVVEPGDATNKKFKWRYAPGANSQGAITISNDGKNLAVAAAGTAELEVYSEENEQISWPLPITVHNYAKTISVAEETLYVEFDANAPSNDISAAVMGNITIGPQGFAEIYKDYISFTATDQTVVSGSASVVEPGTSQWSITASANAIGQTTVTLKFWYHDYLMEYTDPTSSYEYAVQKTFTIVVQESAPQLTGMTLTYDQPNEMLIVTPQPSNAAFDGDKVNISLAFNGAFSSWTVGDISGHSDGVNGAINFGFDAYAPGLVDYTLTYEGTNVNVTGQFEIGAAYGLATGWSWRTLFYGNVLSSQEQHDFFGDNLVEVRTQEKLLYNDPTYGYFGDLYDSGLSQNVCFKLKIEDSATGTNSTKILYGGSLGRGATQLTLHKGWTWLPNPYVYTRLLSNVLTGATSGDRIVSKSNGFAEYNGTSWVGDLTALSQSNGYLYYNAGNERSFSFASEASMRQSDERSAGSGAPSLNTEDPDWQYDASLFRDNMGMIATLNVDDIENYIVGAFVNDECRGVGRAIEGRLFITVHGQSGEQVSFRLYNKATGEYFNVEETVKLRQVLGTLAAPYQMTKGAATTGIDPRTSYLAPRTSIYNSNGMRQQQLQRGVNIVHMSNGRVVKVTK